MIDSKKILAVITARGGSKGVPGKNIRALCGKPLIAWTIEAARESKYIDRTVLSSEDDKIIQVAREWNCEAPFVRPRELALDTTPGIEPLLHAVQNLPGFDYVVLLQPTSPLRKASDIDGCIELCMRSQATTCVSLVEAEESPYWMYRMNKNNQLSAVIANDFKRRQDLPPTYLVNGAIYVAEIQTLVRERVLINDKTIGFIMPRERSLDIDRESDFDEAQTLLKESHA